MTQDLLRGRHLAANVVWNLLGQGLPTLVALACIPPLVARLGNERFGILSIALMLVGYLSLLDLGLGWAVTRTVAQKMGSPERGDLPAVIWPALVGMALFSTIGCLLLGLASPWLAHDALNITAGLRDEAAIALFLTALSLPAVVLGAGLRGILEAHQRFVGINVLRAVQSSVNFLAPLIVTIWSLHLGWVVAVLFLSRWLTCGVLAVMCLRTIPDLGRAASWRLTGIAPMLRLGGWMTVSNVVSPQSVPCDRFLAALLLPMAVIPFYTVPFDLMSRILVAPAAICAVVFPALATAMAGDTARIARILHGGMVTVMAVAGPICMLLGVFAPEFLHLWLDATFAQESTAILRILAVGIILSIWSTVPISALQAAGQVRRIALVQVTELLIYLPLLWLLIYGWGLTGLAVAWTARAGVDALLASLLLLRAVPDPRPALLHAAQLGAVFILPIIFAHLSASLWSRLVCGLIGLVVAMMIGVIALRQSRSVVMTVSTSIPLPPRCT